VPVGAAPVLPSRNYSRHTVWRHDHVADVQETARENRRKRRSLTMKVLRILVVEDDTITGMLLGELLTSMGYDVCAIESTEADAVTAAARCRPDLMIVDVRLGEGSGVSAVEEILRAGPVSHVFVSGDISGVPALTPGTVIIRKPYREPDLAQAIQRAIGAGT
jgi:CheY-like chemotaxis protein